MTIAPHSSPLPTPSLKRRLISVIYEALLLFGLIFFTGIIFDISTQSHHALSNRYEREILLFIVIGCYFTYFWRHAGQTLAMKTWKIRITNLHGERISVLQALSRYCLMWMWFIPAFIAITLFNLKQWNMVITIAIGIVVWALTIYTNEDRQYLHDVISKTRLVSDNDKVSVTSQK